MKLDELEALLEKATPGNAHIGYIGEDEAGEYADLDDEHGELIAMIYRRAAESYLCAAWNSLPGLLAEIRAARELAKAVILFVNDPREVGIGRAAQYKMEFETLLETYRKARAANEGTET